MRFKFFFFMAWLGGMIGVPLYLIHNTDLMKDLIFPTELKNTTANENPFGQYGEYGGEEESGGTAEDAGDDEFYGAEYVDREYFGDDYEEDHKPQARKAASHEAEQIKVNSLLDAYKPDNLRAMMKQIEATKKNMLQHQKMLDELMKDDPSVQKPEDY